MRGDLLILLSDGIVILCIARCLLQWAGLDANHHSPVSVSLQRIFESVLRPFVFLRVGRYDFSGSVLALALWFWLGYVLPQLFRMLNLWLLQ